MNLKQRMLGIEASLDDLQSGVEASSRAAEALETGAERRRRPSETERETAALNLIERYTTELQTCADDQRAALDELRKGLHHLQHELARSEMVRPPPPSLVHDRHR